MSDVFTSAKRSQVMSLIRGRGNRDTELALIRIMRDNGITGWRRNQRLFGRPDFVFRLARLAVFVDGCFWHQCPSHSKIPTGNQEFWKCKLEANKKRDRLVNQTLKRSGWKVIRIWEHDLCDRHEHRVVQILKRRIALASAR